MTKSLRTLKMKTKQHYDDSEMNSSILFSLSWKTLDDRGNERLMRWPLTATLKW